MTPSAAMRARIWYLAALGSLLMASLAPERRAPAVRRSAVAEPSGPLWTAVARVADALRKVRMDHEPRVRESSTAGQKGSVRPPSPFGRREWRGLFNLEAPPPVGRTGRPGPWGGRLRPPGPPHHSKYRALLPRPERCPSCPGREDDLARSAARRPTRPPPPRRTTASSSRCGPPSRRRRSR